MDDLISRKAILKNIEKIRQGVQMMDDTRRASIIMNGMYLCEKAVSNQPSAQPEPRWIPCSERLPHGSCSDLVNVSIHDDSGDTPFDYTSCGWVTTDGEYWIVDNEINNHVVAWMPLPEPYTEDADA